jgi:hypothetical protein
MADEGVADASVEPEARDDGVSFDATADRSVDADASKSDATPDTSGDMASPCTMDAGPMEDIWIPDVNASNETGGTRDAGTTDDAGATSEGGATSDTGTPFQPDLFECTADMPCPLGLLCVGAGCDDGWQCFAHYEGVLPHHPCPKDMAPYCGCNGVTFYAIRSCPDRPYDRPGRCEDGVNCDPTSLRCSGPEIFCPEGQVPSVTDGHYDRCVPIGLCQCEFVFQCPHREKYACNTTSQRCEPVIRDQ